ncbi:MAG TPA: OmpW family outer membrane protein [Candidatus Polarisedimenticolaceae bacterium]|nr:OmpW family outer membrane protein [Candidatus Polarisedimenticolaceae bacterium]
MVRAKALVLIAVVLLGVSYVAAASGDETRNDVGVLVGYIAPSSDSTIGGVKTKAESTVDYGIEYKHRFLESARLSVGATVLYADFDVKAASTKVGDVTNTPILIDVNWHFLKNKALYLGATVGYSMWGNFQPNGGGGSVNIKNDTLYGVNLGYDIAIGKRWAILTNVRYLGMKAQTDVSGAANQTVDVNPIVANVGFAFRF